MRADNHTMRTSRLRFMLNASVTLATALTLTISQRSWGQLRGHGPPPPLRSIGRNSLIPRQRTSGVLARDGIENYPVGCSGAGTPISPNPWVGGSVSGSGCSLSSQQANVDGLMILVQWKT